MKTVNALFSYHRWPAGDMKHFEFSDAVLDTGALHASVEHHAAGGYASFEGWVRDHNDGRSVRRLEYEAYVDLAIKEGERIVAEAITRFGVRHARCVHRVGSLELGELAVWVGVSSAHRAEAFAACRYIIDEVKHRVPIWKKEHYTNGDSGWVNCERCAQASDHTHSHQHVTHHPPHEPHAHPAGLQVPDYSRQTILASVGPEGQRKIRASRVLVVGAGGLGTPVLSLLAGAGVGTLGVVDDDTLDPSNLHRQTMYSLADCGRPKALLAAERIRALNPEVDVRAYVERAAATNLVALSAGYDVLVDCSDNFSTRFTVNDTAVQLQKTAVVASVYQYEGQIQVIRPNGACLRCLWPKATSDGTVGNCAEAGVLGPVPSVLGSLQALEVLKLILGLPSPATHSLILVDLLSLEVRRLETKQATECVGNTCQRIPQQPFISDTEPLELLARPLQLYVDEGYTLIDLRDDKERAADPLHVEHQCILAATLSAKPQQLNSNSRYLLLCSRGQRSLATTKAVRAAGISSAWSMQGGLSRAKKA